MTEKAKEIRRAEKLKKSLGRAGVGLNLASATGIGSNNITQLGTSAMKDFVTSAVGAASFSSDLKPSTMISSALKQTGGGKALKLGQKTATEDAFLKQLQTEDRGVTIIDSEVY